MSNIDGPFGTGIRDLVDGVNRLADKLSERSSQPRVAIDLILNVLLCGDSLLLFSPPGTGVSGLIREATASLSLSLFTYLVSRFTEPAELLGPSQLITGNACAPDQCDGSVPDDRRSLQHSDVAFLDGDFTQLSSAMASAIVSVLDANAYGDAASVRRRSLLLRGDEGAYGGRGIPDTLLNRTTMRLFHSTDVGGRLPLTLSRHALPDEVEPSPCILTPSQLAAVRRASARVGLGDCLDSIVGLRTASEASSVLITDRQLQSAARHIQMSALRHFAGEAAHADLWCLPYLGATHAQQSFLRQVLEPGGGERAGRGEGNALAPVSSASNSAAEDDLTTEGDEQAPFASCTTDKSFLFASYSHRDSAEVYQQLGWLHGEGYRIWYDEGVMPSEEWPDDIAEALTASSLLVVFVTPEAVNSRNVRNEIHYALKWGKPILAIHLRRTELPAGLDLQMGSVQALNKYTMAEGRYQELMRRALDRHLRGTSPKVSG